MPDTLTYSKTTREELELEHGAHGQRFPGGIDPQLRTSVTLNTDQVNQPRPMLQVIFFSKIHYVTPEEFQENAAEYQKLQRKDCLLQLDEVESNRHYYQQWAYPDRTADAVTAAVVRAGSESYRVVANFFRDVKEEAKPSLQEFDDLALRLRLLGADIAITASNLTYERIHDQGVQLAQCRADFRRLAKLVNGFQQRAISSAETSQHI